MEWSTKDLAAGSTARCEPRGQQRDGTTGPTSFEVTIVCPVACAMVLRDEPTNRAQDNRSIGQLAGRARQNHHHANNHCQHRICHWSPLTSGLSAAWMKAAAAASRALPLPG